jgi:hypothetical protein
MTMRARWKLMTAALCAACATGATTAVYAAEIAFTSQSDFTEISLNIKDTYSANPNMIALDVTLSLDAQQRMQAATSAALNQDLTVLINGQAVSTSHVQSAIDTPQLSVSISRQVAMTLLPSLLGVNGGANPPAISPAAAVVIPAPSGNPEPLFASPPVDAQPQQVVPPTVSESAPEVAAAMPAPESESDAPMLPMPPAPPVPSIPPDLGAAPVADPAPSALPQETIMAPAVVAANEPPAPVAPAAPVLPVEPPPAPQVPRWAIGAWLPTSATPSPYAEIYTGDAVAISAHAVNALTCNQARTHVLESSTQQVRLQIDQGTACIINKIQIEQLRISPSATPGKVVISLYSPGDDMNGAPAIEGSYLRKP